VVVVLAPSVAMATMPVTRLIVERCILRSGCIAKGVGGVS
jgi:hypothetical protein